MTVDEDADLDPTRWVTGPRRTAEHGTDAGYYRHRRRPDDDWPHTACGPCRAAHATAERHRLNRQ